MRLPLTVVALLWVALLAAAPLVGSQQIAVMTPVVRAVYLGGSFICHQRSDRSFHLAGVQQPVCARCFGLYGSAALGVIAGVLVRRPLPDARRTRLVLLGAALPTIATIAIEALGLPMSSLARFLAAVPLGATAAVLLARAIDAEPGAARANRGKLAGCAPRPQSAPVPPTR